MTLNERERRNGHILRYFTELMYDVVVKQLPRFQNLLLIVYGHIKTIVSHFPAHLISLRSVLIPQLVEVKD